jgi:hypothetical protein
MRARLVALAAVLTLLVVAPKQSFAGHHLWKLTQVFSSADGTVQFAQLFCTDDFEQALGPYQLSASGHTINFVTNLPSTSTGNKWILVATSGFQLIHGGVTPDYIIPANFFPTGGGTIDYAGVDSWPYGAIPTDGIHSLKRDGTTMVNSIVNFAGATGSINLASAVPAVPSTAIVVVLGIVLLAASGLLRKQARTEA